MRPVVRVEATGWSEVAGEALVLFACEGEIATAPWFGALDERLGGLLAASGTELSAGADSAVVLLTQGRLAAGRLVIAGLGPAATLDPEAFRRAAGAAVRAARHRGLREVAFAIPALPGGSPAPSLIAQAVVEGALSAAHRFDRYKTTPEAPAMETIVVVAPDGAEAAVTTGARRGTAIGEAVAFARDLCATPPNDMGPAEMAAAALALAADPRLTVTVLDQVALDMLGMGALLAVGRGSHRAPLFIEVRYRPAGQPEGAKPVVLVGKTVTFDSGGLSLKQALEMDRQKADMAGGATVLAAVRAAAALDLPIDVVALLPVVENMPGGGALRPGDVVRTLSGRTVEVLNTDAEGRLILADALHHAGGFDPAVVIDIATLTGASTIVFGPVGIGFFCNDESLAGTLTHADRTAGERLWRLPLWPAYRPLLASGIADLANIASTLQQGSMMTAASFLQTFVGPWPWAHLDVYNTAWNAAAHPYLPPGPTASGTRTLLQFLIERAGAGR